MDVVKVENLGKVYKGGVEALKGISFSVEEGSVFAILGPNGAGKTTTLKSVMGLLKPTSGKIETLGNTPFPDGIKDVSFVPEEKAMYDWMKVSKIAALFEGFAPRFSMKKFTELSKRLELTQNRKVGTLSQGNRTKLYLALALAQEVKLYILDEPTWGLDPVVRAEVLEIVRETAGDGKTVIYSSHILSEVEEVCDRLIVLKDGKIIYKGDLDELKEKNNSNLSKAFLDLVKGDVE